MVSGWGDSLSFVWATLARAAAFAFVLLAVFADTRDRRAALGKRERRRGLLRFDAVFCRRRATSFRVQIAATAHGMTTIFTFLLHGTLLLFLWKRALLYFGTNELRQFYHTVDYMSNCHTKTPRHDGAGFL